jgi:uncharacterized protein with von Willebrand factor type A (vWA) domain
MDLIAEAVAAEARAGGREAEDLRPAEVAAILEDIRTRNMTGPSFALTFWTGPDSFDASAPWQASSYSPREGAARLREGG